MAVVKAWREMGRGGGKESVKDLECKEVFALLFE